MGDSLLQIKNLRAWYQPDRAVLTDLSIKLREHEAVGLIGLNGAGKTTLLKTLSGIHEGFLADGVWMQGSPVKFRDRDFKKFRYTVFAEDHSFPYFTFREYLSYVFSAYGRKAQDAGPFIQGFHFEEYVDALMKDLSTGNRKKVFLITAFALKPELLLLDEPADGLDFQSTEYLYRQIAGYKEYGTVLFSSHILESITLTSDRVMVLEDGQIGKIFEDGSINAENIREALRYENDI